MKGIIYCASNLVNGKKYTGQTINSLNRRKNGHLARARNDADKLLFHKAIRKYGESNFEWNVVEEFFRDSKEELRDILNLAERYYISLYQTNDGDNGYNLTSGGDCHAEQSTQYWGNLKRSGARRELLSNEKTKYWADLENRERHKKWMCNYYQTLEGEQQAQRHSIFMKEYYNGDKARVNKAKTSKWFVLAKSPNDEEHLFVSSKEPNIFFGRDVGIRNHLHNIGDKWVPTNKSMLYGWAFEAIEKYDIA